MRIYFLKTFMNIFCISTSEIPDLQIDIQPRIKVELSHTHELIDPITGDVFYFINNDSTGTIILECGIKYNNDLKSDYELLGIQYCLIKYIKKKIKNEAYMKDIHKPICIPFSKKKEQKTSVEFCKGTDEPCNELPSPSQQVKFSPISLKISIGISGIASEIIRRLKNHLKISEGDSFADVAFSYTFIERKHEDNPFTNSIPATITSKMFVFAIEEIKDGVYYMSLNYVKPEDYHIPTTEEVSPLENPRLTE